MMQRTIECGRCSSVCIRYVYLLGDSERESNVRRRYGARSNADIHCESVDFELADAAAICDAQVRVHFRRGEGVIARVGEVRVVIR